MNSIIPAPYINMTDTPPVGQTPFPPSSPPSEPPRRPFDGYDIPRETINPLMKSSEMKKHEPLLQKSSRSSAPRSPTIVVSPPEDDPQAASIFAFPSSTPPEEPQSWTANRTSLLLIVGISVSLIVSIIFIILLFVVT